MHSLIADIAELSQIESGNVSLDVREVSLSNLVDEIFVALSSKANERTVTLINEVEPNTHIRADLIKFNRQGGSVTVSARLDDDNHLITVTDTGEGIISENLKRIFERFYRVDRGRTRDVGGTGLGLAIVKHLARLHGGEVTVASTLGQGTSFTVELPRQ